MKQNKNINGITPLQNYSSAKTSLPNNEPKGFKLIDWQKGTVNLDLGGGKTTFGTDYLKKQGVKNLVFDFNYSISHNKEIAEYVKANKVDTVTCFNVLNVLDTNAAIDNMCLMAAKALKSDGTAYFQVYNKGSKGASQNNQSFQQGEPLSFYVPFVEKYFDKVKKTSDLIIATKPIKTTKKSQWQFAFDSNEGILFGVEFDAYDNENIKKIQENIWKNGFNSVTLQQLDNLIKDIQNGKSKYLYRRNGKFPYGNYIKPDSETVALGASIIVGGGKKYRSKTYEQYDVEWTSERRYLLIQWAKLKGIWFDNIYRFLKENGFDYLSKEKKGGNESEVFGNGKLVIKIINPDVLYPGNITNAINRFLIHNYLFGDNLPIYILGFTIIEGRFRIIAFQTFIRAEHTASKEEIRDFIKRTIPDVKEEEEYCNFHTDDFIIHDLHQLNVLKDEFGDLYVIDNFVKFNNNELSGFSHINHPNFKVAKSLIGNNLSGVDLPKAISDIVNDTTIKCMLDIYPSKRGSKIVKKYSLEYKDKDGFRRGWVISEKIFRRLLTDHHFICNPASVALFDYKANNYDALIDQKRYNLQFDLINEYFMYIDDYWLSTYLHYEDEDCRKHLLRQYAYETTAKEYIQDAYKYALMKKCKLHKDENGLLQELELQLLDEESPLKITIETFENIVKRYNSLKQNPKYKDVILIFTDSEVSKAKLCSICEKDAEIAGKILKVKPTKLGLIFDRYYLEKYLSKLTRAGYRVGIVEEKKGLKGVDNWSVNLINGMDRHELFGLGSLISEPTKQTFYENLYKQLESIVKDDSFEKNGIRNFILSHIPEDYKNDDIEGIVEVFYQRLRALKCGENNELSGLGDIELDTTDYDSKHINNLAPGKNIPESIIENLNKNGMTVENIEKLQDSGFPVCKYKTQITVHGNCPELKSNYVGYYSCLVKNQNNSLGIKWNGIDTEKKERIIKLALDVRSIFKNKEHIITKNGDGYYINNCWNRHWNSTVTYLWQAVTITEGERRYSWQLTQTDKDNINAIAKKISEKLKGLFFGYIEVHYPVIKITILGIYEKNMDKFCQAVFDYTQSEIKELYDEYKKLANEKWQLQQLQREKAEKERDEYFEEWKKQNPMPENFVPISRYPVKGDIIAEYWGKYTGVSMAKDGGYYFDKESFKPEIVFQKFYNSFGKLCYRRCDKDGNFTERHGDEFKGEYPKDWYLKTNAVTKPKPPEKKPETPTVTTTPGGNSYNLQIVDYSEKGVVLTGDTKPIKDEIKALGGKFGMRFDTSKVPSGVGWIFPKTKLAEVEKLVAKYSTKGGNIETDKALQMLELKLWLLESPQPKQPKFQQGDTVKPYGVGLPVEITNVFRRYRDNDKDKVEYFYTIENHTGEYNEADLQLVSDSGLGCLKLDTLSGLTPINKLKRINQIENLDGVKDMVKAIGKNIKNAVRNINLPVIPNASGYTLKILPDNIKDRKKLLKNELKPLIGLKIYNPSLHDDILIIDTPFISEVQQHSAPFKDSTLAALNIVTVLKNAVIVPDNETLPHSNLQKNLFIKQMFELRCKIKDLGVVKLSVGEQSVGDVYRPQKVLRNGKILTEKKTRGENLAYCLTKFRFEKLIKVKGNSAKTE